MILTRSKLPFVVLVVVLCGRAAYAQNAGGEGAHSTMSVSIVGQSSEQLGTLWPGVSLSAGVHVPVAGAIAIRTEAMVAGFIAGGDVIADCLPGAPCLDKSTPGGIFGGTASVLLRRASFPLYAAIGIGAWRSMSDSDGFKTGPTFAVGVAMPSSSRFALELRYDRPTEPIGLMNSTFAIGVRVRP